MFSWGVFRRMSDVLGELFFEKNVISCQILTSFAKSSILDVWQESEYVSTQWTIKD